MIYRIFAQLSQHIKPQIAHEASWMWIRMACNVRLSLNSENYIKKFNVFLIVKEIVLVNMIHKRDLDFKSNLYK